MPRRRTSDQEQALERFTGISSGFPSPYPRSSSPPPPPSVPRASTSSAPRDPEADAAGRGEAELDAASQRAAEPRSSAARDGDVPECRPDQDRGPHQRARPQLRRDPEVGAWRRHRARRRAGGGEHPAVYREPGPALEAVPPEDAQLQASVGGHPLPRDLRVDLGEAQLEEGGPLSLQACDELRNFERQVPPSPLGFASVSLLRLPPCKCLPR